MQINRKNIFLLLSLVVSIIISNLLWDKIYFAPNLDTIKNFPESIYVKNNFNHLNEIFRYCVYIIFPSLTYIFFLIANNQLKIPILPRGNILKTGNKPKDYPNLKLFNSVIFFFLINFFFYKFSLNNLDSFHEGMHLTAGQNYAHYKTFWTNSFITVGGGFEFLIPFLSLKIFDSISISNVRVITIFLIFFNQLILLYFAYKFSFNQNLPKILKNFLFLTLVISIYCLTNFYHPLLIFREIPLVIFLILIWSILNRKYENISLFFVGLLSCLSIIWGLDRGAYLNAVLIFFIFFLLLNQQIKNIFLLFFSIFFGWFIFYYLIGDTEFNSFLSNTAFIYGNMDYIHGIIHPTPFYGEIGSSRSGKNLLLIILTSILTIKFCLTKNSKLSLENKIFFILLFFLAFISYKTGLSRSDPGHMRSGMAFCFLDLILILTFQLTFFFNNHFYSLKKINYVNNLLIIFFIGMVSFFLLTKGDILDNNKLNVFKYIELQNNSFLTKDESKKYEALKVEFNKDDCVQNLTYDTAIPFMISKPSCNKFYFPWSIGGKNIQKEYIDLLSISKSEKILVRKNDDFPEYRFKTRFPYISKFLKEEYKLHKEIGDYEILIKKN